MFDLQIKIERPFSYPLSTDYHSYENVNIKKEEIMTMDTVKKEPTKNEEKNRIEKFELRDNEKIKNREG